MNDEIDNIPRDPAIDIRIGARLGLSRSYYIYYDAYNHERVNIYLTNTAPALSRSALRERDMDHVVWCYPCDAYHPRRSTPQPLDCIPRTATESEQTQTPPLLLDPEGRPVPDAIAQAPVTEASVTRPLQPHQRPSRPGNSLVRWETDTMPF